MPRMTDDLEMQARNEQVQARRAARKEARSQRQSYRQQSKDQRQYVRESRDQARIDQATIPQINPIQFGSGLYPFIPSIRKPS